MRNFMVIESNFYLKDDSSFIFRYYENKGPKSVSSMRSSAELGERCQEDFRTADSDNETENTYGSTT
ncbi:hypothetical protein TNCV_651641 [Trichonephila clavipes]|nr:hypothetical protein TNCV_651641 [Trichonephila clavipes]